MKQLIFVLLSLFVITAVCCDISKETWQIEGTVLDKYVGEFGAGSSCVSVVLLDTEGRIHVYCPDADKLSIGYRYKLNLMKPGPVDYWVIKHAELISESI
jgi:hypothetical protein